MQQVKIEMFATGILNAISGNFGQILDLFVLISEFFSHAECDLI